MRRSPIGGAPQPLRRRFAIALICSEGNKMKPLEVNIHPVQRALNGSKTPLALKVRA
jgi:hypothetical protein